MSKWAGFDVMMLIPGLPCNGKSLENGSLGGSESAGIYMAKALSRLGQHVKVFSNTPDRSRDEEGVEYYPVGMWQQASKTTPHDVTIVQRMPEAFAQTFYSKLNLLWMHDLALGRSSKVLNQVMWNVDKLMVLSEFQLKQYMEVTGLTRGDFLLTRNGIDLSAIERARAAAGDADRDPFRLVYAARPERGLDMLLKHIMPRLLKQDSRYHLHIYGYHNPVEHMQAFYNECRGLAAQLGKHVEYHEPLIKEDLYKEYLKSGIYVYPTPSQRGPSFAEISCITAMEAQACGLPIVTSDRGALNETIGDGAGVVVPGDPWREDYQEAFCRAVTEYANDNTKWTHASVAGEAHANTLGWEAVAVQWVNMFEEQIRGMSSAPSFTRMARHLWRTSDIVALKKLDSEYQLTEAEHSEAQQLLQPFDFAFKSKEAFAEQYARIAKTHNDGVFEMCQGEPRFQALVDWLKVHDELGSVLDYGCGLGSYAFYSAQATGKTFTGVDIDQATIDIGIRKSKEIDPSVKVSYVAGTHEDLPDGEWDCGLLQEVLEHVPEPWTVLEAVEKKVKKDGWVYITVPYGPWEYSSYYTYPWRCHIWHFDQHDIRDMLGDKPELAVSAFYYTDSPELGTPMGWWIITYRADHKPVGKIDLHRKLWLARPKQTVSCTMLVGGAQAGETLGWCLSALTDVIDELVVVDGGMTQEAAHALNNFAAGKLFPVTVVKGPNPIESGFEVARNAGLMRCAGDWVLWVDSDERMINPRMINKYTRENRLHGYGIRQHHFACDTQFDPDMPIRLFRRRPFGEKQMKFYGAIHEHPELGLNEGPGPIMVMSDVHLAHIGYLIEGTRLRRFTRNYPLLKLDQERYPDRLLQKHFMMRDGMIMVNEALRINGGRVDEAITAKCREVIELFREHFLGKRTFTNSESLVYYSEALKVLGEGFDAAFQVEADKENAVVNGTHHYRFANQEDFLTELNKRAREKVAAFDSQYW